MIYSNKSNFLSLVNSITYLIFNTFLIGLIVSGIFFSTAFAENSGPMILPDDDFVEIPKKRVFPLNPYQPGRAPSSTYGSVWVAQGPGPITNGQVENIVHNNEVIGAVHVVLPHPTDPDVLYAAGVNGGIWKTSNATSNAPNWTPLTDMLPSLSIGALDFDYSDSTYQTLVAGVGRFSSFGRNGGGRNGVHKTINGGATWSVLGGTTLENKNISGVAARGNIIVVSVDYAIPYSCSNIGIFRSTDGGATFTQSNLGTNGMPTGVVYDLEGHPNRPGTLYCAVKYVSICDPEGVNGIYKSTDTGASWAKVSDAVIDGLISDNDTSNVEFSVYDDGAGTHVVYVGILNSGQLINGGVFRSDDGGGSWQQMDVLQSNTPNPVGTNPRYKPDAGVPGGQGAIHFSIEADPLDSDLVYVGGDRQPNATEEGGSGYFPNSLGAMDYSGRLFRGNAAETSGNQWAHLTHIDMPASGFIGGGTASFSAPHADSREMAFDADGRIIEGDDGGIYRRTLPQNNTGDWFSIIGNLCVTEMHDIAYDANSNVIISGNQDTGTTYQPTSGATMWTSLTTADGGDVAVDNITLSGLNQSIRYSSFQNLGAFRKTVWDENGALLASSYPSLSGFNDSPQFVTPMELNRIDPTRIIFGGANTVFESFNQGESVNPLAPPIRAYAMAYGGTASNTQNLDVLWVAGDDDNSNAINPAVYMRSAAGSGFMETNYSGSSPVDIIMDPSDWHTAYVIEDNAALYRTTNTGASYDEVTGGLSDVGALRSLAYVEGNSDDYLLVGTDAGVFIAALSSFSNGKFNTWSELGDNLPNAPVYDMVYNEMDDVLVIGTLGRGAWSIPNLKSILEPSGSGSVITPILMLLL